MAVLDRIFAQSSDVATTTPKDPAEWFINSMGGQRTTAGVRVSPHGALTLSAYFACQRVIAEDEGKLPLIVYERLERGKARAPGHPAYRLLHDQANPMMSSQAFRETLTHHALGWGNGYAEIVSATGDGRRVELWPLHPSRVQIIDRGPDKHKYAITAFVEDGVRHGRVLSADRIFHLHGLGFDGLQGYSIAQYARESLGIALATQEFGGRFFSNGANAGSTYQTDRRLSPEAYARLRESLSEVLVGVENSHKATILEEGLKFSKTVIPPNDAQWLESRQFSVEEVCRWHRVAPHKVQHLLRATFSNIEHLALEHVTDAMMPWQKRWENEIQRKIIRDDRYFAEHLNDALLRGDTLSRYQAHQSGIAAGWKTRNEAREQENLNPLPGLDEPLTPVAIAQERSEPPPREEKSSNNDQDRPRRRRRDEDDDEREDIANDSAKVELRHKAFARIFADAAQRIVNKEQNATQRAEKKHGRTPGLRAWLDGFYAEFVPEIQQTLTPIAEAFIENETAEPLTKSDSDWIAGQIAQFAQDHRDESCQIAMSHGAADESWKTTRAPAMAVALIERMKSCQNH